MSAVVVQYDVIILIIISGAAHSAVVLQYDVIILIIMSGAAHVCSGAAV